MRVIIDMIESVTNLNFPLQPPCLTAFTARLFPSLEGRKLLVSPQLFRVSSDRQELEIPAWALVLAETCRL